LIRSGFLRKQTKGAWNLSYLVGFDLHDKGSSTIASINQPIEDISLYFTRLMLNLTVMVITDP